MGNVQLSDQLKAISVRSILALSLETISPLMYSFSKDFKEVIYIYNVIVKRKIYIFITILFLDTLLWNYNNIQIANEDIKNFF